MYRENENFIECVTHDFDTTIRQTLLAIDWTQESIFEDYTFGASQ